VKRLTMVKTSVFTAKPQNPISNRPLKVFVSWDKELKEASPKIKAGKGVKRNTVAIPAIIPQMAPV